MTRSNLKKEFILASDFRGMSPSWQGGVVDRSRHGGWNRKPRAHILNCKYEAENKLEVGHDCMLKAVPYFLQQGCTTYTCPNNSTKLIGKPMEDMPHLNHHTTPREKYPSTERPVKKIWSQGYRNSLCNSEA